MKASARSRLRRQKAQRLRKSALVASDSRAPGGGRQQSSPSIAPYDHGELAAMRCASSGTSQTTPRSTIVAVLLGAAAGLAAITAQGSLSLAAVSSPRIQGLPFFPSLSSARPLASTLIPVAPVIRVFPAFATMSGRGGGGGGRPQVDKAADFANYFCTYAYLYHQKDMLSDRVRMNAYRDAVMKNKAHFVDKVRSSSAPRSSSISNSSPPPHPLLPSLRPHPPTPRALPPHLLPVLAVPTLPVLACPRSPRNAATTIPGTLNPVTSALPTPFAPTSSFVVLDVGTGSGILAIWAAQAGARRVYAVEATDMAQHAETLARANGVAERVTVLQGSMEDVQLPEKVDVIISEWMGYFLVRESMLDSVLVARDRWLKPGGSLFPSHARMWVAPVHSSLWEGRMGEFRSSMGDWRSFVRGTREDYGVDMAVLDQTYEAEQQKYFLQTGCWESLYPSQVLGRPVMIREIDCATATVADVEEVKAHFTTRAFAADKAVNAIGGWFDVLFKGSATDPTEHEVQLTTAPSVDEGTHWGQQVFLLAHPLHVREGDEVSGAMHIRRSKKNHRLMDVDLQLQCQHTDGSRSPNTIAAYFIE
ncbi:unnamed protein product [Closterium sp. Naga37s-1]|nr:unnamed protein product [Closterium sp. Naga37s-1]